MTRKGAKDPGRRAFKIGAYSVETEPAGFLGYVNYTVSAADGSRVGGGGISRDNFASWRSFWADLTKTAARAIAEHEGRKP